MIRSTEAIRRTPRVKLYLCTTKCSSVSHLSVLNPGSKGCLSLVLRSKLVSGCA